jgi:hypothetical protein
LCRSGIEPAKRIFDHRPREVGKSKNARPRRVNEQLSIVQLLTPDIIGDIRVAENGVIHRRQLDHPSKFLPSFI